MCDLLYLYESGWIYGSVSVNLVRSVSLVYYIVFVCIYENVYVFGKMYILISVVHTQIGRDLLKNNTLLSIFSQLSHLLSYQ